MRPEAALHSATGVLVKPSPSLLVGVSLLALTGADLVERLDAESSNPALLVRRHQTCPTCGRRRCACGPASPPRPERREPGARVAAPVEQAAELNSRDELLAALRLEIRADLYDAATLLIGQIDQRGLLPEEARAELRTAGLDPATLTSLLTKLRIVGPPGIGARDSIEALVLQLDASALSRVQRDLARRLLSAARTQIEHGDLAGAARTVGASVDDVLDALAAMRRHLTPFPGLGGAEPSTERPAAAGAAPDVYLNSATDRIEIVVREREQFVVVLDPAYRDLERLAPAADRRPGSRLRSGAAALGDAADQARAARLLAAQLQRRWRTVELVAGAAVACHEPVLLAESLAFSALTQGEIAHRLRIHESTVSRAVRGRVVRLPWGETIPFRRFFGAHHAEKDALLELLRAHERGVSDRVLAEELAARGHPLARRTVAKYRAELVGRRRR